MSGPHTFRNYLCVLDWVSHIVLKLSLLSSTRCHVDSSSNQNTSYISICSRSKLLFLFNLCFKEPDEFVKNVPKIRVNTLRVGAKKMCREAGLWELEVSLASSGPESDTFRWRSSPSSQTAGDSEPPGQDPPFSCLPPTDGRCCEQRRSPTGNRRHTGQRRLTPTQPFRKNNPSMSDLWVSSAETKLQGLECDGKEKLLPINCSPLECVLPLFLKNFFSFGRGR